MRECIGTDFCNRGCIARHMRYKCCICKYRYIDRFYYTALDIIVYISLSRKMHALCPKCKDINGFGYNYMITDVYKTVTASTYKTASESSYSGTDSFGIAILGSGRVVLNGSAQQRQAGF
jgi:phage FluMu protein Com